MDPESTCNICNAAYTLLVIKSVLVTCWGRADPNHSHNEANAWKMCTALCMMLSQPCILLHAGTVQDAGACQRVPGQGRAGHSDGHAACSRRDSSAGDDTPDLCRCINPYCIELACSCFNSNHLVESALRECVNPHTSNNHLQQ